MAISCLYKTALRVSQLKMTQRSGVLVLASVLGCALQLGAAENSAAAPYGCVSNQGQLDDSFGYMCQSGGSRLMVSGEGYVFHTDSAVLKGRYVGSGNARIEPAASLRTRVNFFNGNNAQT